MKFLIFIETEWQTNKELRRQAWTMFNAIIVTMITYGVAYANQNENFLAIRPFLLFGLNLLTKYINLKYRGDLGVPNKEKEEILESISEDGK